MDIDDETIVKLLNEIILNPNPTDRIQFAMQLELGLGRLLMLSTVPLEQLINKLQADHDEVQARGVPMLPQEIVEEGLEHARFTILILRVFLKHRPAIVRDLRAEFPDKVFPE